MANHFSALKRARQTKIRTDRNKDVRTRLRNSIRALRKSLKDAEKAKGLLPATVSLIDKTNAAKRTKGQSRSRPGRKVFIPKSGVVASGGKAGGGTLKTFDSDVEQLVSESLRRVDDASGQLVRRLAAMQAVVERLEHEQTAFADGFAEVARDRERVDGCVREVAAVRAEREPRAPDTEAHTRAACSDVQPHARQQVDTAIEAKAHSARESTGEE